MSVSSLPEWKQLLLEKKRREEEGREKREKEEEKKFASMPAWKRGIIQRRKANELSLSPDPGLWIDGEVKLASQVSVETIVPVHENPFIRTQSTWRKGRDSEAGNETEVKEREKDKSSPKSQDGESRRGREIELKIERFRDVSEGREKEMSRDRSQGREKENNNQWKESVKDAAREREFFIVRKDEEEKETDPPSSSFSPLSVGQSGEGKDWEGGQGVERRDSWRIGKPLSRIESLREKIRQRELEKLRQREAQGGGGSEGVELNDTRAPGDWRDERGTEIEKEWEAAAQMRKLVEAERGQEDAAAQTSATAFDVTQEVGVLKTCLQLPVSVPLSQAIRVEEVAIAPSLPRSQSPDNTLKLSDYAPTPASSPCSPSPSQSPSVSPSPTPSPTLFSVRSASGGQVKIGSTITIAPKKPAGRGVTGPSTGSTAVGSKPLKSSSQQAQVTSAAAEPVKKKYPTVEEIEVIGGYQNLDKSCLFSLFPNLEVRSQRRTKPVKALSSTTS
uniref:Phostensin n=1 Tax=Cyclopterus lumpus TaxID=8103 RepID=A0A8C2ZMA1_CYCLU